MHSTKRKSQNWGSSFLRTKVSKEQYLLQKKTIKDVKYWEWLFIVISVVGVLINIGFNGYQLTMALIIKDRYLFPMLLIVNNLFAIYFLFDGIIQEKPFQILMQLITRAVIWIFNMIYFLSPNDMDNAYIETLDEVKAIRFYISSAMLFITIPVGVFVLYQYWTSNISLFKAVGTEPKYVNMCRTLYLGNSMITFDVEITIIALVLVASRGLSSSDLFGLIVLPLGLVFTLIWAFIGYFAIQKESRYLTYFFYFSSHLQPIYVIYLLVRSSHSSVGALLFYSIIFVGILFFITHVSLLVTVVKIQLNYDRGLKQAGEKEIARTKSLAQSLAGSSEYLDNTITYRSPLETDI